MKTFLLGILYALLLLWGAMGMAVYLTSTEDLEVWQVALILLPAALWGNWTYRLLTDRSSD